MGIREQCAVTTYYFAVLWMRLPWQSGT